MARWQSDTPVMRRALTLVMIWLVVWVVLGYRNHNAILSYDQRPGYREAMERCAGSRFETSLAGELYARTPGRREMAGCTEVARAAYLRAEVDEQRRVTLATLAWALLPSLLLLLFAAFAPELRRQFPGRSDRR